MQILILAGGSGKRLWPLDNPPKQFRRFGGPYSLLQLTLLRFLKSYPLSSLHVITTGEFEKLAQAQLEAIHPSLSGQLIVEPEPRNTAPAIAFALRCMELKRHTLVAPADHFLDPEELFLDQLAFAKQALPKGKHCLFGIKAPFPNPEYGYLLPKDKQPLSPALHFIEKPSEPHAIELLQKGYLWNSGIFLFDTEALLRDLPDPLPPLSIDRVLLEKAEHLHVMQLPLLWSDLGSWDGIYAISQKDPQGNVLLGEVQTSNVHNCLVIAEKGPLFVENLENQAIIHSKSGEKIKVALRAPAPCQL